MHPRIASISNLHSFLFIHTHAICSCVTTSLAQWLQSHLALDSMKLPCSGGTFQCGAVLDDLPATLTRDCGFDHNQNQRCIRLELTERAANRYTEENPRGRLQTRMD